MRMKGVGGAEKKRGGVSHEISMRRQAEKDKAQKEHQS